MPPEFSNRKLQLYEYNGKKILGKPDDIKKLKEKLEKEQIQDLNKQLDQLDIEEEDELDELSKQLDQLDIEEEENNMDDLIEDMNNMKVEENNIIEDMNNMKVEEEENNMDEDNIQNLENILNEIQIKEDEDIDSITKVQNELYKCLGLIS